LAERGGEADGAGRRAAPTRSPAQAASVDGMLRGPDRAASSFLVSPAPRAGDAHEASKHMEAERW
jgi:hypothetical protein